LGTEIGVPVPIREKEYAQSVLKGFGGTAPTRRGKHRACGPSGRGTTTRKRRLPPGRGSPERDELVAVGFHRRVALLEALEVHAGRRTQGVSPDCCKKP